MSFDSWLQEGLDEFEKKAARIPEPKMPLFLENVLDNVIAFLGFLRRTLEDGAWLLALLLLGIPAAAIGHLFRRARKVFRVESRSRCADSV